MNYGSWLLIKARERATTHGRHCVSMKNASDEMYRWLRYDPESEEILGYLCACLGVMAIFVGSMIWGADGDKVEGIDKIMKGGVMIVVGLFVGTHGKYRGETNVGSLVAKLETTLHEEQEVQEQT